MLKNLLYKNKINVALAIWCLSLVLGSSFNTGCSSDKPVVIPCPACVEPEGTPKADCVVIKQKIYYYCDEPVVKLVSSGIGAGSYEVLDPVCRGENGEPATWLRPIKVGDFYARAPEICEPGGASGARLAFRQLKADYDYNLTLRGNALLEACSTADGSCINLEAIQASHQAMKSLSEKQLFKAGVMPIAGGSGTQNIMIVGDLGVLKKKYLVPAHIKKLFAPRHFYCSPGPILACDTRSSSNCENSEYVESSTTDSNSYGCMPGITTMFGNITDAGGSASYAGPQGMAGMIRGITDRGVRKDVQKRSSVAANTFDSAATSSGTTLDPSAAKNGAGTSGTSLNNTSSQGAMGALSASSGAPRASGPGLSKSSGSGSSDLTNISDEGEETKESSSSNEEQAGYDTITSSRGGMAKAAANPLAGLLSGLGGGKASGTSGDSKGVKALTFGKDQSIRPVGSLTDEELEALLHYNAGSSLFEIASRRYFKWGATVLVDSQQ